MPWPIIIIIMVWKTREMHSFHLNSSEFMQLVFQHFRFTGISYFRNWGTWQCYSSWGKLKSGGGRQDWRTTSRRGVENQVKGMIGFLPVLRVPASNQKTTRYPVQESKYKYVETLLGSLNKNRYLIFKKIFNSECINNTHW